ncbi:MAG TPA: 2-amino-4-hydroxy-6-hydroxymethyldihydropteridine diphosphokinase [Aliiroseovarius sp.]|nr:2-amino-4-hydroxy-6-hydroxymethyldihydropteridine diphosphokinase [Aliiroseovarius sp.]
MLQEESKANVTNAPIIALGSNTSRAGAGPAALLSAALRALDGAGLPVAATSRFYATPCFPAGSGPDYVNAAARLDTDRAPGEVLKILHRIEADFGRERRQRWASRSLDLDLIAMGATILPDAATQRQWVDLPADRQKREAPDRLILPHPRLQDRAFVLIPMADIAPDWRHPVLGKTVRQMLDALPASEKTAIIALDRTRMC